MSATSDTIVVIDSTKQRSAIRTREALQLWRDGTVAVTATLVLALAGFATYSGIESVAALSTSAAVIAEEDHARFELLLEDFAKISEDETGVGLLYGAADPVLASTRAAEHAIRPPSALAFLSTGVGQQYPYWLRIRYDALELVNNRETFANPELGMDGRFDLIFFIVFLMPLFVIIFSFNLISREKELGSWRMSLAQPLSPGTLILTKFRARLLLLSATVVTPLLLAIAAGGNDWHLPSTWLSALILIAGVVLYMTFWLGVTTLSNIRSSGSATNAAVSVFAWLLVVLTLPALLQFAGRALYPTPSQAALIQTEQEIWDSTFTHGHEELEHRRAEAGMGEIPAESREIPDEWSYLVIFHRDFEEQMAEVYAKYDQNEADIASWQTLTGWISPATAMTALLESTSGDDYARHAAFMEQAREYHKEFNEYFLPLIYSSRRLRISDYEDMPRSFTWTEIDVAERLSIPLMMLGALLFANVIVVFGCIVSFRGRQADGIF